MTSNFAQTGKFSERTSLTVFRLQASRDSTQSHVDFYCSYLRDVAPLGLTVHYIAVEPDYRSQGDGMREEILLMTDNGKIFMSGLVSAEPFSIALERTAGNEAYTNWSKGEFTPDGNKWRFFIGTGERIRFFSSNGEGDGWVRETGHTVVMGAWDIAAFLQQEFDKIRV